MVFENKLVYCWSLNALVSFCGCGCSKLPGNNCWLFENIFTVDAQLFDRDINLLLCWKHLLSDHDVCQHSKSLLRTYMSPVLWWNVYKVHKGVGSLTPVNFLTSTCLWLWPLQRSILNPQPFSDQLICMWKVTIFILYGNHYGHNMKT